MLDRLIEVNGGPGTVASQLEVNAEHLVELANWSHLRVA